MPASIVKAFARKTGRTEKAVERLWSKAKSIAAEEGHSEDWEYIVGILKRMLRIESSGQTKDSAMLCEVWGDHLAERLIKESMPASVQSKLLQRYLEIEKQLRAAEHGGMSMDALTRALRQAVYTVLNWLGSDDQSSKQQERFRGSVGLI